MNEIKEIIKNEEYFKNKEFEIFPIQKYGKKTKFLLIMDNHKYTLIVDEKTIKKYQLRLERLGKYFKDLIGLYYLNEDKKIMVLDYYGEGKGITLSSCQKEEVDHNKIALKLKEKIENIHRIKSDFINVSTRFECKNWYEFIRNYMENYLKFALEQKAIPEEEYQFILHLVDKNKEYFTSAPLHFLHGEMNEDNICFNIEQEEVYLIDFDDCLIGDILYEYARLFQYEHIPSIHILKETFYPTIEKNPIFLLYTIRNQLLGYWFEKINNYDTTNSLVSYRKTLELLKQQ